MINSRSFHVAANGIISFFLTAEYYSIVYMEHIFFIHLSYTEDVSFCLRLACRIFFRSGILASCIYCRKKHRDMNTDISVSSNAEG